MRTFPDDKTRLELLNEVHPGRPWRSCAEKRRCVVCDGVFRGRDVVVHSSRPQATSLACPVCGSAPALWVRLGNPLLDDRVWAEWESAMELVSADDADDADGGMAAVG